VLDWHAARSNVLHQTCISSRAIRSLNSLTFSGRVDSAAPPLIDYVTLVNPIDRRTWNALDDLALKLDLFDAALAVTLDTVALFDEPKNVFIAEIVLLIISTLF
jgi:hypothetical protein